MTHSRSMPFLLALLSLSCLSLGFANAQTTLTDGYGEYVRIPGGLFQMGDNFNEGDGDEVPVHPVRIATFYIGKYKITNAEYKKFVDAGGYADSSHWEAGGFGDYGSEPRYWENERFKGGNLAGNEEFPVVGVSWYEAMAYCAWLSSVTGEKYRLPTEAEWERSARGADQRRFAWGDDINGAYANFEFSGGPYEPGITPVGYYDGTTQDGLATESNVSQNGAYDMIGNVWEWCLDWYDGSYYSTSPVNDPRGPESGSSRTLRAGGWVDSAYFQRAANRNSSFPENRNPIQGFRAVRER
ncbi:formylglycine-generating enzyme family protein [Gemmatimonadota bacterium]